MSADEGLWRPVEREDDAVHWSFRRGTINLWPNNNAQECTLTGTSHQEHILLSFVLRFTANIYIFHPTPSPFRAAPTAAWSSNNPSFVSKFIAHKQTTKGYAKRIKGSCREAGPREREGEGCSDYGLWIRIWDWSLAWMSADFSQYKFLLRNLQKANKRFDTWIALTARIRQGQSFFLPRTKETQLLAPKRCPIFGLYTAKKIL